MQDPLVLQPKQNPLFIEERKITGGIMQVQSFLDDVIDTDSPEQIKKMLADSYSWLANSASLVASARYYLEQKRKIGFDLHLQTVAKIPASTVRQFIDCHCADEIANYEYAQRQNACITHRTEGLRSLLSFAKEEMNQIRIGTITK